MIDAAEPLDWEPDFYEAYERLGNAAAAVRELVTCYPDLRDWHTYERRKSDSKRFNQVFADRMAELDAGPAAKIEERLQQDLINGKSPAVALKYLEANAHTRARYKPAPLEINVSKTTHQLLEFRTTVRAELVTRSHDLFGSPARQLEAEVVEAKEVVDA